MFNQYFGFIKTPFSKAFQEKEAFQWKDFQNLRTRLDYFLKEGGFFLLTGPVGSGKSTALRFFNSSLNPNSYQAVYLNTAFDRKQDFYRTVLTQFYVNPPFLPGEARNALKKHLQDMAVKRITPIIILDEAQNIPGFMMEEIRLLSNFDFDTKSIVYFILSGHKLLQNRLANLENEALRQRITLKFHLQGLTLEETCAYIRHQLTIAGSTASILTDSTMIKIFEESKGIPRMINRICSALLLAAMSDSKKIVDDLLFDQVQDEWK